MFKRVLVVHAALAAASTAELPLPNITTPPTTTSQPRPRTHRSTTTETTTTIPTKFVPPPGLTGPFEAGLVTEQFDVKSGNATVVAIDPNVTHWGKYVPALALRWIGALRIKEPGAYRFKLTTLGMSQLILDGRKVLELADRGNDNSTGTTTSLDMASGYHSLAVEYAETMGKTGCLFEYAGPDNIGTMQAVPAAALWHQRGPCSLSSPELLYVANPPCFEPRRWALDDGEHCEIHCMEGYFSSLSGGSMELLRCKAGSLLPQGFVCEKRPCLAPQVVLAENPSCKEGAAIGRGGSCTPQCRIGYGASVRGTQKPGVLQCDLSGTLHGYFTCELKSPCQMPLLPVIHGADPLCKGGIISHGARCIARCQPGYAPTRNLTCNNGMLQPASFECNPLPSTTQSATVNASTQPVSTLTTTTTTVIAAVPAMLQELSLMTGEFINGIGDMDVSDLPRFWPILTAMVVLLLCLCLCLTCCIRGSSSKRRRRHKQRRADSDSWTSSEDESDTASEVSENAALSPKRFEGKHNLEFVRANELVAHDVTNHDTAAAAAAAATAAPWQHPNPTPQASDHVMAMEGLNTQQKGRLEALRPKGLRQHTTDSSTSFMRDLNTPPQQQLPESFSFVNELLGSEPAGWGGPHDVPEGQTPSFHHSAGAHSAIPSQLQGFPWEDPLPADNQPQARILESSWNPLDAVPAQVQERDPYTWCDVRTEEQKPTTVAWSDVRIDE